MLRMVSGAPAGTVARTAESPAQPLRRGASRVATEAADALVDAHREAHAAIATHSHGRKLILRAYAGAVPKSLR